MSRSGTLQTLTDQTVPNLDLVGTPSNGADIGPAGEAFKEVPQDAILDDDPVLIRQSDEKMFLRDAS